MRSLSGDCGSGAMRAMARSKNPIASAVAEIVQRILPGVEQGTRGRHRIAGVLMMVGKRLGWGAVAGQRLDQPAMKLAAGRPGQAVVRRVPHEGMAERVDPGPRHCRPVRP